MTITYRVVDIARLVSGTVTGNAELALTNVNSLNLAGPTDLSFIGSSKHFEDGERSRAGCVIAPAGFSSKRKTVITVANPKLAFVKMMWMFRPDTPETSGVHPTAVIDSSAKIGQGVSIGPAVTIGPRAEIGDEVRLAPGVAIGADAIIGAKTRLYPNVTVYQGVIVGCRVIIHAGTVIGSDGFGFVTEQEHHLKVPQLGNVVIEDDVEIGANCTVDRATFGSTIIHRGTKLDNLVHIAHNVTIGEHSLFAAQVGIAGSSKIGSYVMMAGQSGVADNAEVGDHVTMGAQTGVITGQIIAPNQAVWGIPARRMDEAKERFAGIGRLPFLRRRVMELEARLQALEQAVKKPARQSKSLKRR